MQGECEQGELLHGGCSQTCSALGPLVFGQDLTGLQLCLVRAAVFKPRAGTAKLENKAHGRVALRVVDVPEKSELLLSWLERCWRWGRGKGSSLSAPQREMGCSEIGSSFGEGSFPSWL